MVGIASWAVEQSAEGLVARLVDEGVEAVAFVYADNAGVTRMKGVPVARLADAARTGVGMSPTFDVFLADDSTTSSPSAGGPVGELRLVPDLDALVVLGAQPGWAWVPVERWAADGSRHPQCHRHVARFAVERAAARGLHLQMGFELEWVLGSGSGPPQAFIPVSAAPAYGTRRLVEVSDYSTELLRTLRVQGHAVAQFHPENAPGQLELSLLPTDPVGAADSNLVLRQTIHAVGARHGLRTSFSPAITPGGVGNGAHLHLSIWRDGHNLLSAGDGPHGITDEGNAFLAGVLVSLPALLAIGAPSVASYLRLVPGRWSGPFRCWGLENREAALRLVAGADHSHANVEVKVLDATANPYLVVAAVIAAGLAGIDRQLELPAEVDVDPASLPDVMRAQRAIDRLPETLDAAIEAFEHDEVLRAALGAPLFETIVAVRRAECARFVGATDDEIIAATLWRH